MYMGRVEQLSAKVRPNSANCSQAGATLPKLPQKLSEDEEFTRVDVTPSLVASCASLSINESEPSTQIIETLSEYTSVKLDFQ
jgi:hypothetical protein